jgi:hypothetical protein
LVRDFGVESGSVVTSFSKDRRDTGSARQATMVETEQTRGAPGIVGRFGQNWLNIHFSLRSDRSV